MNDRQNMVIATVIAGLMLVVVYLCPWRIESSKEIRWSPIYQSPMTYVRSYDAEHGGRLNTRIESEEAHIAFGILALEVVALLVAGGALYVFFADPEEDEEAQIDPSD